MNPVLTDSLRILIVEDNSADFALMRQGLIDLRHAHTELHRASRLSEALSFLKTQRYHAIVSDLNLPDSEGLQTFLSLKQAAPESAFVVLTGLDDLDTCMRAMRSGAQEYLIKGEPASNSIGKSVRNTIVRQGILRQLTGSAREMDVQNARLQELAHLDPLTGLYNRRGFDARLAHEAMHVSYSNQENCVLLLDVDDFKSVNDRLGHDQGDLALMELSRRIRACIRPEDVAARVGGDEFMVWLSATPLQGAVQVAERIRRAVCALPIPSGKEAFDVSVSVSVAKQERDACTAHAFLARAHAGLAKGKQAGKNQVVCENPPSLTPEGGESGAGTRVLHRPFFHAADGNVAGYEYLCRSQPGDADPQTLPSALEAFRQCMDAARGLAKGMECHVRLHRSELQGVGAKDLLRLLPKELDPDLLSLELRDLFHPACDQELLALLEALGKARVHPVLHDSDFSQAKVGELLRLKPDWVKLSPAAYSGVAGDPFKESTLRGLLKIAEDLGAKVLAFGVESWEDLEALRQLKVTHSQGPLWRRYA